ncbi:putative homoserine O-succinyltransferase [Staphylococcus piscifermentans]|uniref:Homoserine O-acetyltransferase n=1 Tax=Staphylococcus piscifermentans TaxID=70258 RepID=A0A239U496_9STAP|nr:homoserine O-succinyltransferase [Staphylococcus piscifermentans]RTX86560.1 homoserine O-succinyltransferase [Staphylococcus piscifermentans]GEP83527.1 homoserine O-succinyltransferase [Staphylococcus piscifermentans]SNV04780.1 putative homoserine O-succinyltransferase [Staphylococcus piscifermentans]
MLFTNKIPILPILQEEHIDFANHRINDGLNLLIVNLMPVKEDAERQLLRLLGQTDHPINIDFIYPVTHQSRTSSNVHAEQYYQEFDDIKDHYYDGLIMTGAPVEHLDFSEVDYIEELKSIYEWSETHVKQRLFICWGAQFALNYRYGIHKRMFPEKLTGIYRYHIMQAHPVLCEIPEYIIPQSRGSFMDPYEVMEEADLDVVTYSPYTGVDFISNKGQTDLYIGGHFEYEPETLLNEYQRDSEKNGEAAAKPKNYFRGETLTPLPAYWIPYAQQLFQNWADMMEKNRWNHDEINISG